MAKLRVIPHPNNFGARIDGVDISKNLPAQVIKDIREIWLEHQVVYFADQYLSHDELIKFSLTIGPFGDDPYVKSLDDYPNIVEVRREPNERVKLFGGTWHSDWSFQAKPPDATVLHSKIIPPRGGETNFCDGIRAYESLAADIKREIQGLSAIHSARKPYTKEGVEAGGGSNRTMTLLPSDKAWDVQAHPIVRSHPETGRQSLWVNPLYTIGIEGYNERGSQQLLNNLFNHMIDESFIYRHRWEPNMLLFWDNRTVLHNASGGYDGHRRVLHRLTIAGGQPKSPS